MPYSPSAFQNQRPWEKTSKSHQVKYGDTQRIWSVNGHCIFLSKCMNCTQKAHAHYKKPMFTIDLHIRFLATSLIWSFSPYSKVQSLHTSISNHRIIQRMVLYPVVLLPSTKLIQQQSERGDSTLTFQAYPKMSILDILHSSAIKHGFRKFKATELPC